MKTVQKRKKNVKSIRDKVIYRDKQGIVNIYNWRPPPKKKSNTEGQNKDF